MSVQSRLSDAAKKKDIAALRARAEAFDEKMRQIKGKRPSMQEIVEECRAVRQEMYEERLSGRAHG